MKKYKNDIILIIIIFFVFIVGLVVFNFISKKDNLTALVYHENELVETIELSKLTDEITIYKIEVENKEVIIEAKYNAIRIVHSDCPQSYCVNQGFSSSTNDPIVCVPNKILIKLVSSNSEVDIEI